MNHISHIQLLFVSYCLLLVSTKINAQVKPNNVTPGTYRTIYDMLRDTPGLEVKTTNDKSGGTVIIRGTGSLNNQKPPLFVVDGVVYNGNITNINPQDVEIITVLKDAATAAVYGAQGAGGVIEITSKKGARVTNNAVVTEYDKSAYTYFIEHKTNLKVIGLNDQELIKGVIQRQQDSVLVFIKKKKELLIPIKQIKKVEMVADF